IVGEISAASNEQALGVTQVGEAVTQMDQATQQNAALVEEMAAAASSLKAQALDLVHTVSVFKLDEGKTVRPVTRAPSALSASRPRPALATPKQVKKTAPAPALPAARPPAQAPAAGGSWETF
ncbi:MAG: methyl-accepting chemotaxis protein, partial [Rhodoferax sp.]